MNDELENLLVMVLIVFTDLLDFIEEADFDFKGNEHIPETSRELLIKVNDVVTDYIDNK